MDSGADKMIAPATTLKMSIKTQGSTSCMDKRFNKVTLPTELSPGLCEFVGAFIGDGFTDRGKVVALMGDVELDADYYVYMDNLVSNIFELNGKLVKSNFSNSASLRFYSKVMCSFFYEYFNFPKKEKTYSVRLPEVILNSSEKNKLATIRGIYDTDGCVFFDKRPIYAKPYPRIVLDMKSKPLIDQLQKILSKHFTVRRCGTKKRNNHVLEIYGHKQLEKWMGLIGFSNKRHLDRIAKASGEN